MSKRKTRLQKKIDGHKQGWLHIGILLVVLLGVAFVLSQMAMGAATVSGDSMLPTLSDGKIVLYNRLVHSYSKGDIVAVRMPSGESYVKRVLAVEGDTVDIAFGILYVNGQPLTEDYIQGRTEAHGEAVNYPYTVEEGRYFLLGDNREQSVDSRNFGSVYSTQILGKLIGY